MKYKVVIPTSYEKYPWIKRTLFGLSQQTLPPSSVLIGHDFKVGEEPSFPDYEAFLPIENVSFRFNDSWKHQHQIINEIVFRCDDEDVLLILDDDYWMETTRFVENMVPFFDVGKLVFTRQYFQSFKVSFANVAPTVEGDHIDYFGGLGVERSWFSTIESRGHHNPFCGHPKLVQCKDFKSTGGFDTDNFRHYWWCDTDLYYRLESFLDIIPVDCGPVIHVDHPRKNVKAFSDDNWNSLVGKHRSRFQNDRDESTVELPIFDDLS